MQLFIIDEATGDVRRPRGLPEGRIGALGDTATRADRDRSLLDQGFKRLLNVAGGTLVRYRHCTVIASAPDGSYEAAEGPVNEMGRLILEAAEAIGYAIATDSPAGAAIAEGIEDRLRGVGSCRHGYIRFQAVAEQ